MQTTSSSSVQPIETGQFRVSRLQLARVASLLYVRKAWWLIVTFPLFGIAMLMMTRDKVLDYLALVAVFWPLSIPARAILVTRGSAGRLLKPTVAILEADALYLRSEDGTGTKVPLDRITGLRHSLGVLVVELKHFVFVLVPESAFHSSEDAAAFEGRVRAAIAANR